MDYNYDFCRSLNKKDNVEDIANHGQNENLALGQKASMAQIFSIPFLSSSGINFSYIMSEMEIQ